MLVEKTRLRIQLVCEITVLQTKLLSTSKMETQDIVILDFGTLKNQEWDTKMHTGREQTFVQQICSFKQPTSNPLKSDPVHAEPYFGRMLGIPEVGKT